MNWKECSSVVTDRCQYMNVYFSWKGQKCVQKMECSAGVHHSLDKLSLVCIRTFFHCHNTQHHTVFQNRFSWTFSKPVLAHCDSGKSASNYQWKKWHKTIVKNMYDSAGWIFFVICLWCRFVSWAGSLRVYVTGLLLIVGLSTSSTQ